MAEPGSRPAYVAIARKAFESDPFWTEHRVFSRWEAWMDMIQMAQWKPRDWAAGGTSITLARRETRPLSRSFLADRWGWGEKQVYGYLQQLLSMDRVQAGQRTTKGTTYVLVNYDVYNGQGTGHGTGNGTTDAQDDAQDRGQPRGQAKGQPKGQKDKHEAVKHKSETISRNGTGRETWLTPYWDAWKEAYGEEPNGKSGMLSKALRPVDEKYGPAVLVPRWREYLRQTKVAFVNPYTFASGHPQFDPAKRAPEQMSAMGFDDSDYSERL